MIDKHTKQIFLHKNIITNRVRRKSLINKKKKKYLEKINCKLYMLYRTRKYF